MAHDKNLSTIHPGDLVLVRARVLEVRQGEHGSNIDLQTVEVSFGRTHRDAFSLNSSQVEVEQKAAASVHLSVRP